MKSIGITLHRRLSGFQGKVSFDRDAGRGPMAGYLTRGYLFTASLSFLLKSHDTSSEYLVSLDKRRECS